MISYALIIAIAGATAMKNNSNNINTWYVTAEHTPYDTGRPCYEWPAASSIADRDRYKLRTDMIKLSLQLQDDARPSEMNVRWTYPSETMNVKKSDIYAKEKFTIDTLEIAKHPDLATRLANAEPQWDGIVISARTNIDNQEEGWLWSSLQICVRPQSRERTVRTQDLSLASVLAFGASSLRADDPSLLTKHWGAITRLDVVEVTVLGLRLPFEELLSIRNELERRRAASIEASRSQSTVVVLSLANLNGDETSRKGNDADAAVTLPEKLSPKLIAASTSELVRQPSPGELEAPSATTQQNDNSSPNLAAALDSKIDVQASTSWTQSDKDDVYDDMIFDMEGHEIEHTSAGVFRVKRSSDGRVVGMLNASKHLIPINPGLGSVVRSDANGLEFRTAPISSEPLLADGSILCNQEVLKRCYSNRTDALDAALKRHQNSRFKGSTLCVLSERALVRRVKTFVSNSGGIVARSDEFCTEWDAPRQLVDIDTGELAEPTRDLSPQAQCEQLYKSRVNSWVSSSRVNVKERKISVIVQDFRYLYYCSLSEAEAKSRDEASRECTRIAPQWNVTRNFERLHFSCVSPGNIAGLRCSAAFRCGTLVRPKATGTGRVRPK